MEPGEGYSLYLYADQVKVSAFEMSNKGDVQCSKLTQLFQSFNSGHCLRGRTRPCTKECI